jgi:predicted adenylyl cyclase CyaB
MPLNIEIKAACADFTTVTAHLDRSMGVTRVEMFQEDIFFAVPRGRLKMRWDADQTGCELIYYRRDSHDGVMTSRYFRHALPDPKMKWDELEKSYGVKSIVRKRRIAFIAGDVRIHLDDVEGLGRYLEIEVVLNDSREMNGATRLARQMMAVFHIKDSDLVVDAYEDMLASQMRRHFSGGRADRQRHRPTNGST